jgi:PAS domain S-box-containing protein
MKVGGTIPLKPAPKTRLINDARTLQLLLDAVPEYGLYLLDPDGFVASWSANAARLAGFDSDQILGRHFSLFFNAEDRGRGEPLRALNTAVEKGHFDSEGWRVRKDGSQFWASVTLERLCDDDENVIGFVAITRDLSERYEAHRALLESERQFQILVNGVFDYAIYMLDPSGVITSWNTGAERIKGYTSQEIVGQHFSRFYSREDRASGLPARALETAAREGRYEAEGWRIRKDGGRFWASVTVDAIRDDAGKVLGFAKITRDITERRAAQDAIAESERQFRLLVNGVTDSAIYMLDPNGIVSSWNAGAGRIKGYTANEAIGLHFSRFFTEADRMAGFPARALQTAMEKGKYESEGWRVRKDGSLFWASATLETIRDESGGLIGFAKITRDISERREAQLTLDRAQAQIAQSQKMDALGKLTAGVAHDFNNLLMIVGGHAQILKRLVADQPKAARAVEAVEAASNRGAVLTRQLLAFSRQQRLNPTFIDLTRHLAGMHDLLTSSVGTTVKFVSQLPPSLWPVEVDVNELELALVNLSVNARDAMPNGGVITLAAENITLSPGDLELQLQGDFVALTLADDGVGIPADILSNVFDPFFTTKQVDKGTGLGLAQVYGFASQSGGAATISSEISQGTRVTMHLPRAHGEARVQAAESDDAIQSGEGRILLVEDNPDVAAVSAAMLEQLGYAVGTANNATAGLKLLESGEAFDLVFSDIVMAGDLDGIALARRIKTQWPQLPVLLATGYSAAAATIGDEFPILRKPYHMNELARSVFSLLSPETVSAEDTNLVRLDDVRDQRRSGSKPKISD